MSGQLGSSSAALRGSRVAVACVSFALVGGLLGGVVPAASADDDRDRVASQLEAAESRVEGVRADLEGMDAEIAKLYLELEGLNASIPVAEQELEAAREKAQASAREHQAAMDQLEAAQGENQRLIDEIAQAEYQEEETRKAIATYARALYSEGDPSALTLMLTDTSAEDIASRMAVQESMTRVQNSALVSALRVQEQTKSQAVRQEAVTERISALEERARAAAETAEEAKHASEKKLAELQDMQTKAATKKKEWESKKSVAVAQLKKHEAEQEKMRKKLAQIDEKNRQENLVFETPAQAASSGGGFFSSPLRIGLQMTSPFGWRLHPVLGTNRLHNGTDFAANCGTPVYAASPGVVSDVTFEEAGGNVVYVNHGLRNGSSYMTAYVHLEGTNVSPGQSVGPGSVIGWVGTTGYSTGCHLHFSVMQDGGYVDPMPFL